MGLFSRKEGSAGRKPAAKPRPSVSSEAQAAELRVRARRRLAGAVALVLAAVVVLPMLLDSEPNTATDKITVKIPRQDSPFQPNLADPSTSASGSTATTASNGSSSAVSGTVSNSQALPSAELAAAATATLPDASSSAPTDTSASSAAKLDAKKPVDNKSAQAAQKDGKDSKDVKNNKDTKDKARTDDGSQALALLEGRTVASANASSGAADVVKPSATPRGPTKANFVVQAVSLDMQAEANNQRDKLVAQGVSNAYVDGPVEVSGRQYYRVRAGPFSTKESAQAAQTRLRTLGFGSAYIIPQ